MGEKTDSRRKAYKHPKLMGFQSTKKKGKRRGIKFHRQGDETKEK